MELTKKPPRHPPYLFIPLSISILVERKRCLTRDRRWDVASLIRKRPNVLNRLCVGVTPSRAAGEENRCRAAAAPRARFFVYIGRPAGAARRGGGGAAPPRAGHDDMVTWYWSQERNTQAHAVRADRVFKREGRPRKRGTGISPRARDIVLRARSSLSSPVCNRLLPEWRLPGSLLSSRARIEWQSL